MGYIEDLRQKIGNYPIILVGAGILVLNEKNQLLLLRRSDNLCWGLPGGALEPGENPNETALRETYEETGLELDKITLFDVFSGPEFFYQYPNGDQVYNVSISYVARLNGSQPQITLQEHSDYQFFNLNDLPENISPPVKPIIQDFITRQKELKK